MDASKRGKSAKEKGKRGELLLVHFLREHAFDTKRGMVWLNQSDVIGLDGIHIECKFVENLNVRKALSQAIEEAEKKRDGLPAVFWKKSRKEWVVIMKADDWITLYTLAREKHDSMRGDSEVHEDQ